MCGECERVWVKNGGATDNTMTAPARQYFRCLSQRLVRMMMLLLLLVVVLVLAVLLAAACLGEAERGEGVVEVGGLRANGAEQVGARLEHNVLEVLAQEVRVATWDGLACVQPAEGERGGGGGGEGTVYAERERGREGAEAIKPANQPATQPASRSGVE
jgi:hypothetical protein